MNIFNVLIQGMSDMLNPDKSYLHVNDKGEVSVIKVSKGNVTVKKAKVEK